MIVRIDKPFDFGVIIAGIEIVPACFFIVVIATVTDGVDVTNKGRGRVGVAVGIRHRQHLAPGVVGIPGHHVAAGIQDGNDIPLQVLSEGIPYPVVADGTDAAVGVVVYKWFSDF